MDINTKNIMANLCSHETHRLQTVGKL